MKTVLFALALLTGLTAGVRAQAPAAQAPAAHAPAAHAPAAQANAPAASGLTAAQSQQALEILKDPVRRAQLIAVLEAIAKAAPAASRQPVSAPSPAPAAAPAAPATAPAAAAAETEGHALQLAPDSLGAALIADVSRRIGRLSEDLLVTIRTVTDFPLLLSFVQQLVTDPWSQQLMLQIAWRLALVMGVGLAVQWGGRRLLRRPLAALAGRAVRLEAGLEDDGIARAEAGQTERIGPVFPSPLLVLRRVPSASLRMMLLLLPIAALVASSYAMLGAGLGTEPAIRVIILGLVHAFALCRVVTTVQRALIGPGLPSLFRLPEAVASGALRWTRRLAAVGIFGYALAEVGLLFGLYRIAHDALLKLVVLAIYLMLAFVILRHRAAVAGLIRARADTKGPVAVVRNYLAGLWHLVAIFYLLALWMVWALAVPDGFSRLLRIALLTAAALVAARQISNAALATLARWTRVSGSTSAALPGFDQRLGSYHPMIRMIVQVAIWSAVGIVVLEIWSIDAFAWFAAGHVGARLISALVTIGVTLVASLVLWEFANISVERHLARLAREAQLARSARLRTLLPMLRTALLITICLVAGLMVLSEIGVNIAPLLAGAGVVGVALAFGSQKLVQDVITGLFLLLENTMQVGDAVTLGGLSGSVEALSVRTIKLRALDGSVHMIPFSAVTTVTNMTRDFGYAVLEVPVGVNEPSDRIVEIIKEVAGALREETPWRDMIKEDIDVFGLDKFILNGFIVQARMKTTSSSRWAVRRELLRRLKLRFDELAIDSPMTSFIALNRDPPSVIPAGDGAA